MTNILSGIIIILITTLSAKDSNNFYLKQEVGDQSTIEFSLGGLELESVNEYTKLISSSKGSTSEIGMPELPLFSSFFKVARAEESGDGIKFSICIFNCLKIELIVLI